MTDDTKLNASLLLLDLRSEPHDHAPGYRYIYTANKCCTTMIFHISQAVQLLNIWGVSDPRRPDTKLVHCTSRHVLFAYVHSSTMSVFSTRRCENFKLALHKRACINPRLGTGSTVV